jgi:cell division protein FtsN
MENSEKIVFGQPVSAEEDTSDREINQQLTSNSSKEKALYYQESDKAATEQTQIHAHEVESPVVVSPVTKPPVAKTPVASPQVVQTGNYFIVAGSFLKSGNANRQKAELEKKGYSPLIVQKNDDFFYVTLQSFDTKEAATAAKKKMAQDLDLSLWVMKK